MTDDSDKFHSVGLKKKTREHLEEIKIKNAKLIRKFADKKEFDNISGDDVISYLVRIHDDYEATKYMEELRETVEEPVDPDAPELSEEEAEALTLKNTEEEVKGKDSSQPSDSTP